MSAELSFRGAARGRLEGSPACRTGRRATDDGARPRRTARSAALERRWPQRSSRRRAASIDGLGRTDGGAGFHARTRPVWLRGVMTDRAPARRPPTDGREAHRRHRAERQTDGPAPEGERASCHRTWRAGGGIVPDATMLASSTPPSRSSPVTTSNDRPQTRRRPPPRPTLTRAPAPARGEAALPRPRPAAATASATVATRAPTTGCDDQGKEDGRAGDAGHRRRAFSVSASASGDPIAP